MNVLDNPLYQKFPRVAPVADNYGFNCEDIETMIRIIERSELIEYMLTPELSLRALLVRLDVSKDDFKAKIAEILCKPLEEQRECIGIQQMPYLHELYYKWI